VTIEPVNLWFQAQSEFGVNSCLDQLDQALDIGRRRASAIFNPVRMSRADSCSTDRRPAHAALIDVPPRRAPPGGTLERAAGSPPVDRLPLPSLGEQPPGCSSHGIRVAFRAQIERSSHHREAKFMDVAFPVD
jgi:hypothetical protein